MSDPKFMQTTWVIDEHYNEIVIAGYENPFNLHLYGRGKPSDWKEILSVVAAAPAMYALIQQQIDAVEDYPMSDMNYAGQEWMHQAIALLKKIRGE